MQSFNARMEVTTMNTLIEMAEAINILGAFCGKRDLAHLTRENLRQCYGWTQADVMVLFGGSILSGGDVLAEAMRSGIAKKYIIVGGEGHTTETLRRRVHEEYPQIVTSGLPEAEVFQRYLQTVYGLRADFLETQSTNCGNNITYLLDLLRQNAVPCESVILCQDATMQRRMEAGLQKYAPETTIINFAAYRTKVIAENDRLDYAEKIHGMWNMDRYVNLLMGEIPRLSDDENGYGPRGKNFIAHVDVPEAVYCAFELLRNAYGMGTRAANPAYASRK